MNSQKIKLISNSDEYWDKYWKKIDDAKNYIFVVTYDIDNKMIANITLRKLLNAAERGVKVVFITEHINYYLKNSLEKQLRESGVLILTPNPLHYIFTHIIDLNLKKFFNRTHQKVTLIDNDVFIGSLNIASEYSDIKYGSAKFLDLNIYVKNTICFKKIMKFFQELIHDCEFDISKEQLLDLDKLFQKYEITNENGLNDPNNYEEFLEEKPPLKSEIQDNIYDLLENAEDSITIVQPYYTNMKRIEDLLIRAVKRGVKVKFITAEKRDQTAYRYQYNNHLFENVLKGGVEVYEFMDKFLHSKIYYIDRKIINMGSLNNDVTSFVLNNEANYLIKRNQKNEKLFNDIEHYIQELDGNCKKVVINSYRNPLRFSYSHWWYFFIWSMENLVANRDHKYK
jgi:cardiolipin synthase